MICSSSLFFFNDTATTEIYTLSLHDALPISMSRLSINLPASVAGIEAVGKPLDDLGRERSEEHTSELQSLTNLVCRLLLEKKKPAYEPRRRLSAMNVPILPTGRVDIRAPSPE